MKSKIILLAAAGAMAAASCKKTFVCKDQTGMITAEVKAYKQSTATSMCNGGSNGNVTATRK